MDKLASLLIWFSQWCNGSTACEKEMMACAKRHVIEWSEDKILMECWKDPKK